MRQKEVDLVASLKSGEIDYARNYESVSLQNNFKYVDQPNQIDFSNKTCADLYKKVNVAPAGKQVTGLFIEYGITKPNNAKNPELAITFVQFTSRSQSILK